MLEKALALGIDILTCAPLVGVVSPGLANDIATFLVPLGIDTVIESIPLGEQNTIKASLVGTISTSPPTSTTQSSNSSSSSCSCP